MPRLPGRVLPALLAALLLMAPAAQAAEPETGAAAALLYEPESGTVLYAKNETEARPIASVTKLLTALVVLDRCGPEEEVTVTASEAATEGSSMDLAAGERLTVRELLYGLLLASGNDAASALARHAAGSEAAFAELMNEKAAELGLTGSHFTNPHGLDAEGHYATALDLALLAAACRESPLLMLLASTSEARVSSRTLKNHNKLLTLCPGCLGLKTGYTSRAGRTLVSLCEREGTRLICVTLSDPDDWEDHRALYDWGIAQLRTVTAAGPAGPFYELPLQSGLAETVTVRPGAELRLPLRPGEELTLLPELPDFVYAPLRAGQRLGSLTVLRGDEAVARLPLLCTADAPADPKEALSFWEQLRRAWYEAQKYTAPNYRRSAVG